MTLCSRCIMDTTVPGIFFDGNGECNFCKIHNLEEKRYPLDELAKKKLKDMVEKIKKDGKNKDYDCIVGVSGGTDSTYALYVINKLGLRPLAVHMDNGWNSESSVSNIKRALDKIDVDLHTVVLDWEEFKDLQIAFLKASVPDVEIPTDLVIYSVLFKVANEMGIKYVIDGQCFRTGGKCPIGWSYDDGKYVKNIHKFFGKKKMKNFPLMTVWKRLYYMFFKGIKFVSPLNHVRYDVKEVKELLKNEFEWKDYGVKHYESVYTRFIQSYLLPEKFNIDKRKIHYSALIRSEQMTREEALKKIKQPPYKKSRIEEDKNYVIKKLGLSEEEFEKIMTKPPKMFLDYPNNFKLQRFLIKFGCIIGKLPEKHKYYTWDSILNYR